MLSFLFKLDIKVNSLVMTNIVHVLKVQVKRIESGNEYNYPF